MSELGPASKALLDRVNLSFGYVELGTLVSWARAKMGHNHSAYWWYRRLVALALEGHIDAKVYRTGDDIAIKFRKKKESVAPARKAYKEAVIYHFGEGRLEAEEEEAQAEDQEAEDEEEEVILETGEPATREPRLNTCIGAVKDEV